MFLLKAFAVKFSIQPLNILGHKSEPTKRSSRNLNEICLGKPWELNLSFIPLNNGFHLGTESHQTVTHIALTHSRSGDKPQNKTKRIFRNAPPLASNFAPASSLLVVAGDVGHIV